MSWPTDCTGSFGDSNTGSVTSLTNIRNSQLTNIRSSQLTSIRNSQLTSIRSSQLTNIRNSQSRMPTRVFGKLGLKEGLTHCKETTTTHS